MGLGPHGGATGQPDTAPPPKPSQEPAQARAGTTEPTVLAVDATGLLVRCSRAGRLRDLHTAAGIPTATLLMFAGSLSRKVRALRPDYLITAWDGADALEWRRRLDPGYKANSSAPAYLGAEMLQALEFCDAAGIATAIVHWFEADDILAAVRRQVLRKMPSARLIICSDDADVQQLAGPQVLINSFSTDYLVTAEDIEEAWGIDPARISWVRALCGDRSDNIPGLPRVGPSRAVRMITESGSAWPPKGPLANLGGDWGERVLAWKQIMDLIEPPKYPESIAPAEIFTLLDHSRWEPVMDGKLLDVFRKYELSGLAERLMRGRFW